MYTDYWAPLKLDMTSLFIEDPSAIMWIETLLYTCIWVTVPPSFQGALLIPPTLPTQSIVHSI